MSQKRKAVVALVVLAIASVLAPMYAVSDEPEAASVRPSNTGVHAVPLSIDPTCTLDVTEELKAYIASVPDGGATSIGVRHRTILFQPNGCYRVEGVLEITGRNWLAFDGNGSTFKATISAPEGMTTHQVRARAMWRTKGGSNLRFTRMTVVGANPNAGVGDSAYNSLYEAQHSWDILGTAVVDIGNVTSSDIWGDFVYVGANAGVPATDVVVHDSTFTRNGRQCLSVTWAERVTFERLNVSQCRRATLDVEPNFTYAWIRSVALRDSAIGPGRLLFLAMHGSSAPIDGVFIERNTLTGKALAGSVSNPTYCAPGSGSCVSTTRGLRTNIVLRDNASDTGQGSPTGNIFSFTGADNVTVTGNTAPAQAGRNMYFVAFYDVCGTNVVSGNIVPNGQEFIERVPCGMP